MFQSPLHRSIHCDGRRGVAVAVSNGVSVSSSSEHSLRRQTIPVQDLPVSHVSVSSSSEHSLRHCGVVCVSASVGCFSLLFIGAFIATKARHSVARLSACVSVSSSSEHSLRPRRTGDDPGEFAGVSVSSSSEHSLRPQTAERERGQTMKFQSPLHRSIHCDDSEIETYFVAKRGFSLLFIGAFIATR